MGRNRHNRRAAPVATNDKAAVTRDGFVNLAARMGMGAQNVNSEGTYIFNLLTRNRIKLEAMYRGSWIVGAAVDSIAEDMTRAGIVIKGEDDPSNIEKLQSMLTRQGVWGDLLDAIKWGRLYGGALAYIDIDGQDPSTPLNLDTVSKGQFRGLKVYDRWQLQPADNVFIDSGRDVGLPAYYTVIANLVTGELSNVKLHHSRVIRFIGVQLPLMQAMTEMFWGESVIERLYDRLIAFDTATAGAANLIQKAHLRTVQIDGLREVLAAGGQAEDNLLTMFHHMRMLQTNEGITLLDKNDQFATYQYSYTGLPEMILQFGQQVSGCLGIPLVRLFGQSPAGLNSTGESDLRMYYDNVAAQQESRLREGLNRVLRVMYRSLFGAAPPANYDFDFVPLWQTSAKEKADIAKTVTETVGAAFEAGIIDHGTAMKELKQVSEATGVFTNIDDDAITEAENAPPPMPIEGSTPPADNPPGEAPLDSVKLSLADRIKAWING